MIFSTCNFCPFSFSLFATSIFCRSFFNCISPLFYNIFRISLLERKKKGNGKRGKKRERERNKKKG